MESSPHITAIILTRNEEETIAGCIDTLRWCDAIRVADTGSSDRTIEIAQRAGVEVISVTGANFAEWRDKARTGITTEYILYIDADERVTPTGARSIRSCMQRPEFSAFFLKRNNIHYGRWLQAGGWNRDKLLRLFVTKKLNGWDGAVHEHAVVEGRIGEVPEPIIHLTHRSLHDGLRKSIAWTDTEARLFLAAKHPPVGPLRLLKIVIFDFLHRIVVLQAWRDGTEGWIEAMIQSMNRFLVYTRLWELQQKPSLPERYERIERELAHQWQTNKL